jgi:4-amino-4-deoxy-L-arabinose transferase-like glycosyltransferase
MTQLDPAAGAVKQSSSGVIARTLKDNLDKVLLASIFAALSTSTVIWTINDRTPPAWDPADHISAGYDYYRTLAHLDFRAFADELFVKPHYYAPFVHLVTGAVFLMFGASGLSGIAVNLLSLGALLFSTEWICRALYRSGAAPAAESTERSGGALFLPSILAAILAACYHFSAWLQHDAFLDFPLMAVVTTSFAFLLRAGDFTIRSRAVAFGIAAGIGMLTKQTFPFFFVLPSLYVTLRVLRGREPKAIANLALAALIIVTISALWYFPHLNDVLAIYGVNREAAANENEAPVFSFMSNVFYLHALVSHQMQAPLGALFVLGLIYSLARRARQSVMLYLWILSGIAMFTLVANKDIRYSVPVLPAAAVISVCWVGEVRLRKAGQPNGPASRAVAILKHGLVTAIAAWAFISFFNAQWPREGQGYYIDTPRFRWMVFARNYYGFDKRPMENDWSVPEIVRTVSRLGATGPHSGEIAPPGPSETISPTTQAKSGRPGERRPTLGVIVNLPYLNPSSVALYARLLAAERAGPPVIDVLWIVNEASRDRIESSDYLLVRTGLDLADWVAPIERFAEQLIDSNPNRFVRVASFPIPLEQAEAVIYRRGG